MVHLYVFIALYMMGVLMRVVPVLSIAGYQSDVQGHWSHTQISSL